MLHSLIYESLSFIILLPVGIALVALGVFLIVWWVLKKRDWFATGDFDKDFK